jgi:hypothetical protein
MWLKELCKRGLSYSAGRKLNPSYPTNPRRQSSGCRKSGLAIEQLEDRAP